MTSSSSKSSIAVLGGGLAGIAAAVRLAEAGHPVTLVETRKRLGGRATSFVDPTTGQILDNCQHVLMGCCTNLLDLYAKLGVVNNIEWHKRLYFGMVNSAGVPVIDELCADDLPAPSHMTRSMMAFTNLTWAEKFAISTCMYSIMRMGKAGREKLHDTSFADWLKGQNQPASAVEKYWEAVAISAINELPDRLAASYAIQVFQEGFLAHEDAYVMGLSKTPLVRLYDEAERVISAAGGKLLLSRSVDGLEFDGTRVVAAKLDQNERLEADLFVSSLPFDRLAKIATPPMVAMDSRLQKLDQIGVSPIIGIHLYFGCDPANPPMEQPHMVFMRSPLQWVFNKGVEPVETGGFAQHLHGVISAAHSLVDKPADEIIDLVVGEIHKMIPATRATPLVHGRAVKEKRATFSARPGFEHIRPRNAGAIRNLFLAGDWTDTGWPATMEGAVRSGYLAAGAIDEACVDTEHSKAGAVPDLTPSALYRFIAG